MARRTGFATETLSELRYAAQISGTGLEGLEKSVKRMQRTIIEANDGLETYLRAFRHIGVNVEDLMGLSPEEQFMAIAMAIGSLEDPTLKAAVASQILGRAGTDLLPFFELGAEGMRELMQEAHKFSTIFDSEAAVAAEKLQDSFTNLKEATKSLTLQLGEALAPSVTGLANAIAGLLGKVREWGEAHPALYTGLAKIGGGFALISVPLGMILIMLPHLVSGLRMASHAMTALAAKARMTSMQMGMLAAGISMVITGIILLKQHQQAEAEALELTTEAQEKMNKLYEDWSEERQKYLAGETNQWLEATEAIVDYATEMKEVHNAQIANLEDFEELAEKLREQKMATHSLTEAQMGQVEALTDLGISYDTAVAQITGLTDATKVKIFRQLITSLLTESLKWSYLSTFDPPVL